MPLASWLFGVSGFAGLLYQVVWTRRLVLVFGATVYSFSTVLAGFMGGLGLGSLWGSKLAARTRDPWRLYGWLELGVAASASLFPAALSLMLWLLENTDLPTGPARFALTFAALLPPTFLMGATFPVLAELFARTGAEARVGVLYASNLGGACLGTLAGAFLFLSAFGFSGTHWLAVALSTLAGMTALLRPAAAADRRPGPEPSPAAAGPARWILAAVTVSGFCGMAFEVVWTRILVPSFNNSVYGFSSVLFVFLAGLGGGSFVAGRIKAAKSEALGAAMVVAGLYAFVGLSTFELVQVLTLRLLDSRRADYVPVLFLPLAQCVLVLGPLAVLQGIVLPAAFQACGRDGLGAAVGRLYFWNTLGGILGALAAGFWLIPAYASQDALLVIVVLSAFTGALLVARGLPGSALKTLPPAAVLAFAAFGRQWLLDRHVAERLLVSQVGRALGSPPRLLAYAEDVESSVGVLSHPRRSRILSINGIIMTGYTNAVKLIAHVPLLLNPRRERTLIIGFGMGTTFRSALQHGGRVVAADLVGSVLDAFVWFFPDAERWAADPRASRLVTDGRNHLLADREGYDVVVIDPAPPLYAAGTVNLYSDDFYRLARRHLRPGGLVAMWLPEYPESEFRMLMKTFVDAFPHTQFWRGTPKGEGLIMIGGNDPILLDKEEVGRRLRAPAVREDLLQFNRDLEREETFWSLYLGDGERFRDYLAGAERVTDDRPMIEYPYFRSRRADYMTRPAVITWPSARPPFMRASR